MVRTSPPPMGGSHQSPEGSPLICHGAASRPGTADDTTAKISQSMQPMSSPALSQLPRFAEGGATRGMPFRGPGDKALLRNSRRRLIDPDSADEAGPGANLGASSTEVQNEAPLENDSRRLRLRSLADGPPVRRRSLFEDGEQEIERSGAHSRVAQAPVVVEGGDADEREADPADGRAEDAGDDEEEHEEQAHAWALESSPPGSSAEGVLQEEGPSSTPGAIPRPLVPPGAGASVDARAGIAQSLGIPTRNGSPLPARDASDAVQQLPAGFQPLETMYGALEVACKLLRTRRQMCTLNHLAPIMAEITHRRFLESHVAQMLYVVPHLLTVEPVLRQRSDSSPVRSNTRVSRFGASQWDLNISLSVPPLGSSLDQQALGAGAADKACSSFTKAESSNQRVGRHDCGGGGSLGSRDEVLRPASASMKLSHWRLEKEAHHGNLHTGAGQEVKRRRLFPQDVHPVFHARDPQSLRPAPARRGAEAREGGGGGGRRLSDAEAMVWRKREFRRALQALHHRMPLLQAVPEALLPGSSSEAEAREKAGIVAPGKAGSSPTDRPGLAGEELSPVPVRRGPVGGGRRLFSPLEGASREVEARSGAGEEIEPRPVADAGRATGAGGPQEEEQAVTPPASPRHSQRPPGSITKGPGAEADLGDRCRLSLTPVFQRYPPPAGPLPAPQAAQASASEPAHPQGVALMDLHPLLRAEGATSREEGLLSNTSESCQPRQRGPREDSSGAPKGPRPAQGSIQLHPLLWAHSQEKPPKECLQGGLEAPAVSPIPSSQPRMADTLESQEKGEGRSSRLHGVDSYQRCLHSAAAESAPAQVQGSANAREAKAGLGPGTAGDAVGELEEQLDADAAGILGSLPAELLETVQRREEQKRKDGREEGVQQRKRAQLLGELPLAADALATVFASSKVAVLAHRDIVATVASSRARNTNQIEIEQQLALLVELFPQWLTVKVSLRGETLYRINKSFPLSTVRTVVAAEKRKLGPV